MPGSDVPSTFYLYNPSTAAAIVFAILYAVENIILLYQLIRYRAWAWIAFCAASIMELLGYIARVVSTKNVDQKGIYVAQFALVVLAPILMAAAYYVIFGRIIDHVLPKSLRSIKLIWVPPRCITLIFVGCDIIAFLLQAWGAIDVATADIGDRHQLNQGKKIVLIGLGVQIACFGYFVLVSTRAQWTLGRFKDQIHQNQKVKVIDSGRKYEIMVGSAKKTRTYRSTWYTLLTAVNVGGILILVRSIYRVCEFALGKTGYLQTEEWTFYVFDTLPIFICFLIFMLIHPGHYLSNLGFRGSKCDIWNDQSNVQEPMSGQGHVMGEVPASAYSERQTV